MSELLIKEKRRAKLEALAFKQPCPKCGAKPGEGCMTDTRMRTMTHKARIRQAAYLPVPS